MHGRWYYAALSALLPGWGALEWRRDDSRGGNLLWWWTVATLLAAPLVLALRFPVWLIIAELIVVTLWSAMGAYARGRHERRINASR